MHIAVASDHRGVRLKEDLVSFLRELGHEVEELDSFNEEPVDYPDLAQVVAEKVSAGEVERGILICGTGIGMSIVANKFPGVRAGLANHAYAARMAGEHNDVNILVIGGEIVGRGLAREIVKTWLEAEFQGGRHLRRLKKIEEIERKNFRS